MTLLYHDLVDTIYPRVSIDEYEAKSSSDEEVIVVAFYAMDEGPAKDLDDFLEKGPYNIIDVDVSPNPDENGDYLVFVEIKRRVDFWKKLDMIINDIYNLTGKLDWKVSCKNLDYECAYGDDDLRAAIVLDPVLYSEGELNPEYGQIVHGQKDIKVESYLKESLATVTNRDSIIELATHRDFMRLKFLDYGPTDYIVERHQLGGHSSISNPYEVRKLRSMLGYGWDVVQADTKLIISNNTSDNILVTEYIG